LPTRPRSGPRWSSSRVSRRNERRAAAAAFPESSHGGPIPRDRDEPCASKRQAAPRRRPVAFGSPAGPPEPWRRGAAYLRGTSFAVRLAAPEPGSFPTRPSRYPRRHDQTAPIRTRRPDDLGSMRASGVRSLDVSCQCHHRAILSADRGPITSGTEAVAPLFKHSARLVT
jgi:hypothetical protein